MRHIVELLHEVVVHGLRVAVQLAFVHFVQHHCIRVLGSDLHVLEEAVHLGVVQSCVFLSCLHLYGLCIPVDVEHLSCEYTVSGLLVFERRCLLVKLAQNTLHVVFFFLPE